MEYRMHGAAQTTGHGHGHGHEYGISATPVADTTTAPAANSRLCRASQFHFHGANTAARVAEIWAVGVTGVLVGATCTQPHSLSFPNRRVHSHGHGHGYGCEYEYGHGYGPLELPMTMPHSGKKHIFIGLS